MSTAIHVPDRTFSQARMAQVLTIAWMLIEGVVALGAGIIAGSVALTAFGIDSAIEVFSAAVVLRQVSRPRTAAADVLEAGERRAARLTGYALYGLAVYIVLSSAYTLLRGVHPEPSLPGLLLALASVAIMPWLWRWRLALSERIHSSALRADAACSAVCLYMALTLLAGLALNRLFGWWWADPVAGLLMIWWIRGEAKEALEAAATGRHCADC
jgi:divalent metal cation (Fe/Co/Zn/Cd) transporter